MSLKDYIQGKRHGSDAHKLEREAMNDPFLQDAIDGFDSVQGDHLPVIEHIEQQIEKKIAVRKPSARIWYIAAAASVALLIGFSVLYKPHSNWVQPMAQSSIDNSITTDSIGQKDKTDSVQQQPAKHMPPAVIAQARVPDSQPKVVEELNVTVADHIELPAAMSDKEYAVPESLSQQAASAIATMVPGLSLQSMEKSETTTTSNTRLLAAENPQPKSNKIFGRVLDESGMPLIGVSVKYKNEYQSATTDLEGNFVLPAPKEKEEKILFSYIGYQQKEVAVAADSTVVKLVPNDLALNEVVVIGYGAQKKSRLTGAVQKKDVAAGVGTKMKNEFGEKEFRKYFNDNRLRYLCDGKEATVRAMFEIDPSGKPINIRIIKCDCEELEAEFLRLISSSPLWTKTGEKVTLKIQLK